MAYSMCFRMPFGALRGARPRHDPNAPARRPFLLRRRREQLHRLGTDRGSFQQPEFRGRKFDVAPPSRQTLSRANAPRSSAASGSVNSTNAATSIKACQTPSASPARPNSTGAIAPEPIVPV